MENKAHECSNLYFTTEFNANTLDVKGKIICGECGKQVPIELLILTIYNKLKEKEYNSYTERNIK